MRQVSEAELLFNLKLAMARVGDGTRTRLKSNERQTRKLAEEVLAETAMHALRRYEILSSAPLPGGTDLFSAAAYGDPSLLIRGDG